MVSLKITRGYKVRIYPNNEQREMFLKTFGCVRFVWNYSLMERNEIYNMYKDYPKLFQSHKYKTPADWKRDASFLKEVDSQALATTQQELLQAFKNFFHKSHKYPKYKSKKNPKMSYTTHTTNNNIRIESDLVKIPKVGWVKLKKKRKELPHDYSIKAATISKTATNKYYVSLRIEYEIKDQVVEKETLESIGLDFSINDFYIDHKGKKANYPYYLAESLKKLSSLQRKLSKKVKGSNHYLRLKHKIALLHEKIAHQRKDFLHKLSRELVNNYDIITVETLDLKEMSQNKVFSKKITDISYHRFLSYLKYKSEETNTFFHQVDKYYASSKICSYCGKRKKVLPLSQRTYTCECGNTMNRDQNAAMNLATQGIKQYLMNYIEDRTASIAW